MSINIQGNQWLKTIVLLCYFLGGISFSAQAITAIELTPAKLNFTKAGEEKTAMLTNIGDIEEEIISIELTGDNQGDFKFTTDPQGDADTLTAPLKNNCGGTLAGGKNCEITITFDPKATGESQATLEVVTSEDPTPLKIELTNTTGTDTPTPTTADEPAVDLKPTTIDFGNQVVKTTSKEKTVTLSNTGKADLQIKGIKLTGDNSKDFAVTTAPDKNCGGSLAPKAKCQITITFTPAATGDKKATVEVTSNAKSNPDKVELMGTGIETTQTESAVDLKPNTVDFGNQAVKTTSKGKVVTLTNTGKADLQIKGVKLTSDNSKDFAVTTDPEKNCGGTLAPKAKCQITITFTPATAGDKKATVEVTSNAKSSPDKVELTGTGTEATKPAVTATLTPATLDFKKQPVKTPSAEKTVTLKNTGKTDLPKLSINLTGDKDYAQTNDCGDTLAAGKTCQIKVILTPKTAGDKTATLEAKSDKTSLDKVELTGMGDDGSSPTTNTELKVTANPTKLDFGNVIVGTSTDTQTVTLTNEGKDDVTNLEIILVDEQGQFTTTLTPTCGSTLSAGKDCSVGVTFMPQQFGKQEASLDVTSGNSSLVKVPLMGIGVEYVNLGETAIAFDNQGNPVATPVKIKGGVSKDDGSGDFKSEITVDTTDPIIISAEITALPPEEIGQELDIFAVGYYVREANLKNADGPNAENCDPSLVQTVEQGGYYIVKNANPQDYCDWIVEGGEAGGWCVDHKTRNKDQAQKHYVEKWSGKLADLEALYTEMPETDSLMLSEQNHQIIYQGTIDGTGHVCVYLGYRSKNGTLTFNDETINIRIIESRE